MELLQLNVFGNCEICKQRIENAAMSVNGVLVASWDIKNGKLLMTVEAGKTNLETVSLAIARSGHTTEKHRAEEAKNALFPDCCRFISKPPKAFAEKMSEQFY